jgi:hypothetical protein
VVVVVVVVQPVEQHQTEAWVEVAMEALDWVLLAKMELTTPVVEVVVKETQMPQDVFQVLVDQDLWY